MNNNSNFWFDGNNYTNLTNNYNIIPSKNMTWGENLNTITRLIILLTLLGFLITRNVKILISGILCIIFVIFIYNFSNNLKENYANVNISPSSTGKKSSAPLKSILKTNYYKNSKSNPFGNVLLTEINDKPNRKPAPPSFNLDVEKDNTNNVKEAIQSLNPEIIDTNKQLFGDIYQNFELDQSNRVFYSNANTRVTNDQGSFAEFLYGNMPSAKEGNPFALLQDNYRYILY